MTDLGDTPPTFPYVRECPYDPPLDFRRWHAIAPITRIHLWDGRDAWVVTGIEEVRAVLRDHSTFRSVPSTPGYPTLTSTDAASKGAALLPMTDPPEDDVLRRAVQREFSVRRIEEQRPADEQIVSDLLDEMESSGPPVDLVPAYAATVPARFTCRLLGVPIEDAPFFAECLAGRSDPGVEQVSVYQSGNRLTDYFAGVIADRRQNPRVDLSGHLVSDHVVTGELTEQQADKLLHVLLIGGFETTRNTIALGVLLLTERPQLHARLRADPSIWSIAIEELLRYLSVVQYESRAVTRDVQLAGQEIRAGDGVIVALHAANRDPGAFEKADELDVDRAENLDVAFGSGIHQCLGQTAARMLLGQALSFLFDRFPTLRVTVGAIR